MNFRSMRNVCYIVLILMVNVLANKHAFGEENSTYNLNWSITAEAGGSRKSSNYTLFETFGFPMFGSMASKNYKLSASSAIQTNLSKLSKDKLMPDKMRLQQNYPNPFNPLTNIQFELPKAAYVDLEVFNLLGQRIKTLASSRFQAGIHHLVWDGTNVRGELVGSGVYLFGIRVTSGDAVLFYDLKKMSFIK